MKSKMIILLILVLGAIANFVVATKNNSLAKENTLSMINLETLANGEGDGDGKEDAGGDNVAFCVTKFAGSTMEMQKCMIMGKACERPLRMTETYVCEGTGEGTCNPGCKYTFFDCLSSVSYNDLTYIANCR